MNAATDTGAGNLGNKTGDLRFCVNNAASGDTINFNLAQSTTINLNSALTINNTNLTVDGTTLGISLDASRNSRIFNITGTSAVTINNLTLQNGNAKTTDPLGGKGGAIFDSAGSLTLNNDCFLLDSAADQGGAIFTDDLRGPLSVNQCDFSGNYTNTGDGGAVSARYENTPYNITLTSTSFSGNISGGNGGAVSADGGSSATLEADSCSFQENGMTSSSTGDGGAIFTTDRLKVIGTTTSPSLFFSNTANRSGGAIAYEPPTDQSSDLTLTNITFASDSAGDGGGVFATVNNSAGTVTETISGCVFNQNQANISSVGINEGGGIDLSEVSRGTATITTKLNNSTFSQNNSIGNGGGIAVFVGADNATNNTPLFDSLTVYQSTAEIEGGGLWIDPTSTGTLRLRNSIVAGNTIADGPGNGPDVSGTVTSSGNNLIGITDGSGNTQWIAAGPGKDITGTSAAPQDPGLDPNGLQSNGGPTQTIQLLMSSAGYKQGSSTDNGTQDQRGYTRPDNRLIRVSIGAYDPNATPPG